MQRSRIVPTSWAAAKRGSRGNSTSTRTLVFIDETGASTKMAPLHGCGPGRQRLRMSVPHGHWKTTTFTGVLRLAGMTVSMVLDGPMMGEWFLAYVEEVLVPTQPPRRGHHGQPTSS